MDRRAFLASVLTGLAVANRKIPEWALGLAERVASGKMTELDYLWAEPERVFTARGMKPDPWQLECLHSSEDLLFNISRQCGKSELTAAIALLMVLRQAPALILILSPTDRQSVELLKAKFMPMYEPWAGLCPLIKDNEYSKEFANGSRIIALPGRSEANIRSYSSVNLLIIDEASRVLDQLYHAVTPMIGISKGRKIVLSTPFGKRGFFYKEWITKDNGWKKVQLQATQCPRWSPEALAVELRNKGDRLFRQEFMCDFTAATGQLFQEWALAEAFRDDIEKWNLFEDVDQHVEEIDNHTTTSTGIEL